MRFTRLRKSHDPCNCAVREPSVWVTEHSVFATVLLCRTRNKFSSSAKTKIVLIVWFGEYWRILSFILICQWAIINETIKCWLMVHARSTSCRLCEKARLAFCPRKKSSNREVWVVTRWERCHFHPLSVDVHAWVTSFDMLRQKCKPNWLFYGQTRKMDLFGIKLKLWVLGGHSEGNECLHLANIKIGSGSVLP